MLMWQWSKKDVKIFRKVSSAEFECYSAVFNPRSMTITVKGSKHCLDSQSRDLEIAKENAAPVYIPKKPSKENASLKQIINCLQKYPGLLQKKEGQTQEQLINALLYQDRKGVFGFIKIKSIRRLSPVNLQIKIEIFTNTTKPLLTSSKLVHWILG